jgi:hypothetical protein
MLADVPPFPDPDRDDIFRALEQNALARWWRARAGAFGETGARVIARDLAIRPADPGDQSGDVDERAYPA